MKARFGVKQRHMGKRQRGQPGADQVTEQHYAPQAKQDQQIARRGFMHDRQYRRDGVFGKQLLARHDDNDETEGVAEVLDEKTAGIVRQAGVENAFRRQRGTHRQPGGDRRPQQRQPVALQLFFAFHPDLFMHRRRARRQILFPDFDFAFALFLFLALYLHRLILLVILALLFVHAVAPA